MSRVRVHNFAVSLDGYGTGEGQSLESPFGHAQESLMQRFFGTRFFRQMHGEPGGSFWRRRVLRQKLGSGNRCRDHGAQQVRTAARSLDG